MSQAARSHQAFSLPQLYSRDYYWRVPERKIGQLRLRHLASAPDLAVLQQVRQLRLPARAAGITEWQGEEQGHPVSLGWDWMELQDGDVRTVMVLAPRTNIRLTDAKGYDVPEASAAPFLWDLIASLSWTQHVSRMILDERPFPRLA